MSAGESRRTYGSSVTTMTVQKIWDAVNRLEL